MTDSAYFTRQGDEIIPQPTTAGPWRADLVDGAAIAALLAHRADAEASEPELRLARLTVDLLAPVPLVPLTTGAHTVRESGRLKLIDIEVLADGATVARASALLLRESSEGAIDFAAVQPEPLPPAEYGLQLSASRSGGFVDSVEMRGVRPLSAPADSTLAAAWFRYSSEMFPGEPLSAVERAAATAERASSMAFLTTDGLAHINGDFTLYLQREPRGEWLGIDGTYRAADSGVAVGAALLVDERGPIGHVATAALAQNFVIQPVKPPAGEGAAVSAG